MGRKTLNLNSYEQIVLYNALMSYSSRLQKEVEDVKGPLDYDDLQSLTFKSHQIEGSKNVLKKLIKEEKMTQIELCKQYTTTKYPNFKPKCMKGRKASLKCHSTRLDCSDYEQDDGYAPPMRETK